MRVLAVAAAVAALALASGFAAYEWRSPQEPARVEPVELLPPPAREPRESPGKRRQIDERTNAGGSGTTTAGTSSGDSGAPVAPAPAGGGDDDTGGDDDGSDDDGDDDAGDD